jgi:hypothetical protein
MFILGGGAALTQKIKKELIVRANFSVYTHPLVPAKNGIVRFISSSKTKSYRTILGPVGFSGTIPSSILLACQRPTMPTGCTCEFPAGAEGCACTTRRK